MKHYPLVLALLALFCLPHTVSAQVVSPTGCPATVPTSGTLSKDLTKMTLSFCLNTADAVTFVTLYDGDVSKITTTFTVATMPDTQGFYYATASVPILPRGQHVLTVRAVNTKLDGTPQEGVPSAPFVLDVSDERVVPRAPTGFKVN